MNAEQFEKYQQFTENTIHRLSQRVTELEKKLDMFSNLLDISKYINKYIKDPNLFPIINDMLIGVFGAKQSNIYIKIKDGTFEATAHNDSKEFVDAGISLIKQHEEKEFILNSNSPIFAFSNPENPSGNNIHSCLGVPVEVENRMIGFIVILHNEKNYFNREHAVFLSLIGNHIGIAIENNLLYKQIIENSNKDGLTGIFNKRYFFDVIRHMNNILEQNYSIIILDMDNFKKINDKCGHPFGDLALVTVADIIKGKMRTSDIVARYGGDEIIIFMNNFTDHEKIHKRVNDIKEEISSTIISDGSNSLNVTASFGVFIKENTRMTLDECIKKADANLYISKKNGKNRATISWS